MKKTTDTTGGDATEQGNTRQPAPGENAISEEDENFEHTIRRLTIEKEEKRSKNFGLYR